MAKQKFKFKEKKEPRGEERREMKMAPSMRRRMEDAEMYACGGRVKKK